MSRSVTKAAHYVVLLDEARCEGDWDSVPEYVRKVRKHAPGRVCLALTAETELAIEKATRNLPPSGQPATDAAAPAKNAEITSRLPKLQAVIDEEAVYLQDRFQARVCVGWLHWVVGEYDLAFARLPESLDEEVLQPDGQAETRLSVSDWTRVCALKSAYLRANCLARNGKRKEALMVFEEGLPCLTSAHAAQQSRKQLRYWSELFLTEYCMLLSHTLEQGETSLEDPNCLVSFRSWARYWEGSSGAALFGGYGFRGSVPRRRVWFEYYSVLSNLLEDDLPYPTGHALSVAGDTSARNQLRIELKKVEAIYETLLLEETSFPRAEEERQEVEKFVRLVAQNWSIMKSRGWREQDLGQGGKESMSRGVLDILYRASTKTYHSTAILRHLFTVHLAVAEFDLAFKAFDSYLELIKKGKARVAKTGKIEPSLDDDAVVLETVSLCIAALCRYGDQRAAEKAYGLSQQLDQCLHELSSALPEQAEDASPPPETHLIAKIKGADIPLRIMALCWQSVGLAFAQWSRMTFDSAARPDLQAKAIRYLRKSLSPEFGRSTNLRGVFALGLLLSEQRELSAAIELVKSTLLSQKTPDAEQDFVNGPYWQERAMVPLWHMLSLLLSARQDYVLAARACEGAFEQFKDPAVLFGSEQLYRSEHLNEAEANDEKRTTTSRGLVDEMDDFEKERILEIKMTQLALVELLESPKVAVNASLELLTLFTRLFGPLQSSVPALAGPPKTNDVPKSSAGTLRSIKGSIFGRGGDKSARPATKHSSLLGLERLNTAVSRPQTTQTVASREGPTIQVTNDAEDNRRSRRSMNYNERRSQSGKRNSLRKRDSSVNRRRAVSSGGAIPPHSPTIADGEAFFTPFDESQQNADLFQFSSRRRLSSAGPPVSMSRRASQVDPVTVTSPTRARNAGAAESAEASLLSMPSIQFSKDHEKRRRSTILIEVWLMISGFYRRAGMFDDAKGAAAEAQKLVQVLELSIAKDSSGSVSLRDAGWAGKKSVDELWGDLWAEMGNLSLDRGNPHNARLDFEAALTHFPNHPAATVGLANILLDVYSEKLVLPPALPRIELADGTLFPERVTPEGSERELEPSLPSEPLGLVVRPKQERNASEKKSIIDGDSFASFKAADAELPPPYKASSLPIIDRLAARDRAFGLLSGLTKLGNVWNNSDAWFALARAHEESGQPGKAKEVLWWCVELEEAMGVRPWSSAATGGEPPFREASRTAMVETIASAARLAVAQNLTMPALSPTMTEGNIAAWRVKEGDKYTAGDVLLEIETDKAAMDVEAQEDGVVFKVVQPDGSKGVRVGARIAVLAEPDDDLASLEMPPDEPAVAAAPSSSSDASAEAKDPQESAKPAAPLPSPAAASSSSSRAPKKQPQKYPLLPSVAQLIKERGLDAASVVGQMTPTGPGGRLLKGDVLAYLGQVPADVPATLETQFEQRGHLDLSNIKVKAAPQPPPAAGVAAAGGKAEPQAAGEKKTTTTVVSLPVSLAAVVDVQDKIQASLGVFMPVSTFVARATDVANDALPRAGPPPPPSSAELFDALVAPTAAAAARAAAAPVPLTRGHYQPQVSALPTTATTPPKKTAVATAATPDIIDVLSGKAKTALRPRTSAPRQAPPAVSTGINFFSVAVPKAEEKRAKVFLERLKIVLENEPGRLVL
ncbi:filamentation protein [Niveomyces insectorum RCEF 264]|uniref:Filamentation protein n=1 Tax=Niveomyces insectorum RCEF 264 TaxID=1081102 RepID=A0A167RG24_9HYPO|nr:filamentation protein [Niveomyces insectorum RCEF 264]